MDKETTIWTPEEQRIFEQYLLEEMDAREKAGLELRLRSEPAFQSKFLEFKKLFRTIEEEGLKAKLDDFHKDFENNGKVVKLRTHAYRSYYWAAAVIALLILLGGSWYFYAPSAHERLFDIYFTPDPGLPTVMGSSDNYVFYEAMVDYKQGNYAIALEKWEGLLPGKVDNDTLNYFMGAAYLANGEAQKSIGCFDRVLEGDHPLFQSEAAFYKGLAHLKLNEIAKALQSLERTSEAKGKALEQQLKD